MENEVYWSERLANETQKSSDELLKVMKNLYKDSMKNIKKEIESFYGRYAENNNLTLQEVHKRLNPSELKSAKEEIKKYYDKINKLARDNNGKVSLEKLKKYKDELRLQSAKAYMSRLEEVKLNIKNDIVNLAIQEEIEFTDKLKNVYSNSLSQSSYNIDKTLGFSEGFSAPNEDALNKSIKTRWLGENYSDRIWKNKGNLIDSLDTILLQGIAQGKNPRKIADEMSIKYGANYKNCERLARTEFIHAQNEATFQSYKNHKIQEYEYVADLSERTCPKCGSLDGQHFPLKYKQIGINYPVMHPNCRCTTIPYFEKDEIDLMFEESTRIAYDEDRKIYEVPSSMTYEEWKENFM